MGFAQSIPAPPTNNDGESSSGLEGDRRSDHPVTVVKKCRIQWSPNLDADLVRCSDSITLHEEMADKVN